MAPRRPQASGSALRRMLARLEHGVCVTCGLDCANLVRQLQVRLARTLGHGHRAMDTWPHDGVLAGCASQDKPKARIVMRHAVHQEIPVALCIKGDIMRADELESSLEGVVREAAASTSARSLPRLLLVAALR